MMTAATSEISAPRLAFGLTLDSLGRLTGISAAAFGVLVAAGMLNTGAYLSAWDIPTPLLRLDPLTAALRTEETAYQLIQFGVVFWALTATHRRLGRRPRVRTAALTGIVALVALLSWISIAGGFPGPAVSVIGAVFLFAGYRLRQVMSLPVAVGLFAAVALLAATITGHNWGTTFRTQPETRTHVTMSTSNVIEGLPGARAVGGVWHYRDLYLVFRDDEHLYVGSNTAEGRAWLIVLVDVRSLSVVSAASGR